MDYISLQTDLVKILRGRRTQDYLNKKMSYQFNQVHKWETGKVRISWLEFIKLCQVGEKDLSGTMKACFSYSGSLKNSANLVQHFTANHKKTEIVAELNISRSTLSRWLNGVLIPDAVQFFQLMHLYSSDFFFFVEELAGSRNIPSLKAELDKEHAYLKAYEKYPWLSVLLSALDITSYRDNPTTSQLAKICKLPVSSVKEAVEDLVSAGLLVWNGKQWTAEIQKINFRGSRTGTRQVGRYVYERTLQGYPCAFGNEDMRYSWKIFSLNRTQYDVMIQKYTEFFNELGQFINKGQENTDADRVYIFSSAFIDLEHLPVWEEKK